MTLRSQVGKTDTISWGVSFLPVNGGASEYIIPRDYLSHVGGNQSNIIISMSDIFYQLYSEEIVFFLRLCAKDID